MFSHFSFEPWQPVLGSSGEKSGAQWLDDCLSQVVSVGAPYGRVQVPSRLLSLNAKAAPDLVAQMPWDRSELSWASPPPPLPAHRRLGSLGFLGDGCRLAFHATATSPPWGGPEPRSVAVCLSHPPPHPPLLQLGGSVLGGRDGKLDFHPQGLCCALN